MLNAHPIAHARYAASRNPLLGLSTANHFTRSPLEVVVVAKTMGLQRVVLRRPRVFHSRRCAIERALFTLVFDGLVVVAVGVDRFTTPHGEASGGHGWEVRWGEEEVEAWRFAGSGERSAGEFDW